MLLIKYHTVPVENYTHLWAFKNKIPKVGKFFGPVNGKKET
jgi:hypothetical protein